ncbi:MAG: CPBP family intramembrane glutamic endopeptidase [Oscillospiraceae bacterium]
MKRRQAAAMVLLILLCCALVALVDGVLRPGYAVKSAVKLALFGLLPLLYARRAGFPLGTLFRLEKGELRRALLPALGVFVLILGAYFALRGAADFSGITASLTENAGVSRESFPLVALYIALVNSLLEEFFFRGFAFLLLGRVLSPALACGFSAAVFALYHVSILQGWFSPVLYALAMLGLAAGGLLFSWLDYRPRSLLPSYLVHMAANLAINCVGLILFGLAG